MQHGPALGASEVYAALNESLLALRPDFAVSMDTQGASVIVMVLPCPSALSCLF